MLRTAKLGIFSHKMKCLAHNFSERRRNYKIKQ